MLELKSMCNEAAAKENLELAVAGDLFYIGGGNGRSDYKLQDDSAVCEYLARQRSGYNSKK